MNLRVVLYQDLKVELQPKLLPEKSCPRYLLANVKELLDTLLSMLGSGDAEVVGNVWRLIEELPENEECAGKLLALSLPSNADVRAWEGFLQLSGDDDLPRTCYCMYLLTRALGSELRTEQEGAEYKAKLMELGGFHLVISVFLRTLSKPRSKINAKALIYCLKVLNNLLDPSNVNHYFRTPREQQDLWKSVWELLKWICATYPKQAQGRTMDCTEEAELVWNCVNLHVILVAGNPSVFGEQIASGDYLLLLKDGLFCGHNKQLRHKVGEWVYTIWDAVVSVAKNKQTFEAAFVNSLFELYLDSAVSAQINSKNYFGLLSQMIPQLELSSLDFLKTGPYLRLMVNYVIEKVKKSDEGIVVCTMGMVDVLSVLVPRMELEHIPDLQKLYSRLITVLLGVTSTTDKRSFDQHSCRSPELRAKSFVLLREIVRKLKSAGAVLKLILPLHTCPAWRTFKVSDWCMRPEQFERSQTGYVGLENMGCTCYVNAMIQQLFFVDQFRNPLISFDSSETMGLLPQIQQVFGVMYEKSCGYVRPKGLCDFMKISPTVQEDVSTFMVDLFKELQKGLKLTPHKSLIKDLFKIGVVSRTECKVCGTVSESPASSYMLDLEVMHKSSVLESLRDFIKPEIFQGDNAYQCEKCAKKVTASRVLALKLLPNVLILHLKRFGLAPDGSNIKLNTYCEFPMELDMEEFAGDGLPKQYYMYRLKGIIVHTGTLDRGHYYSFLRDDARTDLPEGERWFSFDDTRVRKFDAKDIPEETFGHRPDPSSSDQSLSSEMLIKPNNAYMLVYERETMLPSEMRKNVLRRDSAAAGLRDLFKLLKPHPMERPKIPPGLKAKLDAQREDNLVKQFVFSPSYSEFVLSLLGMMGNKDLIFTLRTAVTYFFTTALRAEATEQTVKFLKFLKKSCYSQRGACKAVAVLFSAPQIIREFITGCPREEARRITVSLLRVVMERLYKEEQDEISEFVRENRMLRPAAASGTKVRVPSEGVSVPYLILMIDAFVQEVGCLSRNMCEQYFQLLAAFARLGPEAKRYLSVCGILGTALEVLDVVPGGECIRQVTDSVTHFSWDDALFLKPIAREETPECATAERGTVSSQQSKFIFELINELLRPTLEIEAELVKVAPSVGGCVAKALHTLAEDGSLRSLFKFSENSLIVTNFLAKIIRTLCEVKNTLYCGPVLVYLTYKLATANFAELRLYTRPLQVLMGSPDEVLFKETLEKVIRTMDDELQKSPGLPFSVGTVYADLIIAICRENLQARQVFAGSKESNPAGGLLLGMIGWLEKHRSPAPQTVRAVLITRCSCCSGIARRRGRR